MGELDLIGQLVDELAAETNAVRESTVGRSGATVLGGVVVDESFLGAVLLLPGLTLVTLHACINL